MKALYIDNIIRRKTNPLVTQIWLEKGFTVGIAANMSEIVEEYKDKNIIYYHIDLSRNPFNIRNIKAYKQLLEILKKEKFDVIHCNTPIGGLLGRLCGKKAKVPLVIYTAHGFHFYKRAPLLNRTFYKWAEMWLARYTDAIITINKEDYQAALNFKLKKNGEVFYVPGVGIDTSTLFQAKSKREEVLKTIGAEDDSILIISVGELNKNKNQRVIIEALGKLKNPKLHYIVCGLGVKIDALSNLAKKLDIVQNVHFLGFRTDIPELLKSSDIFVMPSYREGLSRSLMEAMCVGLPCVVSRIRGNSDLIKEGVGGYLHEANDIDTLAKAINHLAQNKNLRSTMGIKNQHIVKNYDIQNIKKEITMIYKCLIKRNERLNDEYLQ